MRASREIALIVCALLAIYVLLSLLSYDAADPSWSYSGQVGEIANSGGIVGAWGANFLLHFLGVIAYALPFIIGYGGWVLYRLKTPADESADDPLFIRLCGVLLAVLAGCGMAALYVELAAPLVKGVGAGGIVGELMAARLRVILGEVGSTLTFLGMLLIGAMLVTGKPWAELIARAKCVLLALCRGLYKSIVKALGIVVGIPRRMLRACWPARKTAPAEQRREPPIDLSNSPKKAAPRAAPLIETTAAVADTAAAGNAVATAPRSAKGAQNTVSAPAVAAAPAATPASVPTSVPTPALSTAPRLPALSLLDTPRVMQNGASSAALSAVAVDARVKLAEFGIDVKVVAIHPGPVVTRYELQPAPGLKVSRITSLGKDLARSLSTVSVRIEEVIPGKTTIGLEIPNKQRELVVLSELLASSAYKNSQSPLTLVLGKGIAGQPVVADLAAMPHLLVAGTTGSGKSVAINAMILSLLYKAPPEDVRMLMIDPKMLELSAYDGIAHLLAPVVTNMSQAANALRWCVAEMERRYQIMSALGVRNITGYNAKVQQGAASGAPLFLTLPTLSGGASAGEGEGEEALEKLPFIVVVIDEFADMMMTTGKKVEELIVRLAQKARAAGIHLLIATQRPSVNVITGLIKANIPSRVAFQVSSRVDSRTILDQGGAESLLGHGDMLFLGPGTSAVKRIHGAFVADHEVHQVVAALKLDSTPDYLAGVLDNAPALEGSGGGEPGAAGDEDYDELYDQALYIVTETRKASISSVQRRLKIGYNRAARLLERMEADQVVGPLASNGSREVLAPPPPRDSDDD